MLTFLRKFRSSKGVLFLCIVGLGFRVQAQTGSAVSPALTVDGRTGPVLVPMDSWVYSALDRLAAMGYISDQTSGVRPWTRRECIRQMNEAQHVLSNQLDTGEPGSPAANEGLRLLADLRREFSNDQMASTYLSLDSVYTRYVGIMGRPLTDGFNFGQTLINDYGRPYGEGSNLVSGFSARGSVDRFSFYIRGEYEHAAPYSSPVASLEHTDKELVPVVAGSSTGVNQFEPLEMYVGAQFGDWAVTVGKQDLWWGPGESGPFSFSTNAAPFYSFRVTNSSPIHLPGLLRRLGDFRVDLIGGELAGHQFPPRPLMNGQKLTWNMTKDLELGFTRWSLFGGAGTEAFTVGSVLRNLTANSTTGIHNDPGDRKSGFDLRWRLPVPGRWVTLYSDFYADDEPSPLTNFHRSAFDPGIYLARLPGLPRWDLRVEAPSTRAFGADEGGEFFYWNVVYHDANTNQGNLLGSWVGRDGRGLFVLLSHWTSSRSRLSFQYRQNRVGPAFLLGGGTQDDWSVIQSAQVGPGLNIQGMAQFERYQFPLQDGRRQDVTLSLQILYTPELGLHKDPKAGATKSFVVAPPTPEPSPAAQ